MAKASFLIFANIDHAESIRIEEINPSQDLLKPLEDHLYSYLSVLLENNYLSISHRVSYRYEMPLSVVLPITLRPNRQVDPIVDAEKLSTSIRKWWLENRPPPGSIMIETIITDPDYYEQEVLSLRNITLESEHVSDLN